MRVVRLPVAKTITGLVLTALVAACSAGATTNPVSAPVAASEAPLAASAPPTSSAPPPSVAPTTSPTTQAGGGRYAGGGGGSGTPAPGLVLKAVKSALGPVLTSADGLTLYLHAGDSSNHSTCTGSCASAWPPVLVSAGAKVTAGTGVHGRPGTFKRTDGTTQVTYNGRPLYAWPGDSSPGDTTGQGLGGFTVAKP